MIQQSVMEMKREKNIYLTIILPALDFYRAIVIEGTARVNYIVSRIEIEGEQSNYFSINLPVLQNYI